VGAALEAYRMDNGTYPTTEQGLEALLERPSLPPEPRSYPPHGYLRKRSSILDGWGRPFEYRFPGETDARRFDLYSLGRDHTPGGDEELDQDISYWEDR